LGVHQYEGGHFSPNGHKYIREFTCELISKTIYRVGGVIISKERLMVSNQSRTITKYTLLQAHSATTIRFKPFLAFRSVHELCVANDVASTQAIPATKGAAFCLYEPYPTLYLQFSKQPHYHHQPHWYNHLLYAKEQERGYPCTEDLMVPGYFEMPIKKGESIYFTAGIDEISPAALKKMWENELALRQARVDMYHCLRNAAIQFTKKVENGVYLLAGYPWFKVRARDQFIAMPGCTLSIGENATFVEMATTAMREIDAFMQGECSTSINELDAPDALLWFVWSLQQYASVCDILPADMQDMVVSIVQYIVSQHHPNLFLRKNGLLYVDGTQVPMTWMNATENNQPITPRTGFVVEINALWYNALCFAASLVKKPTLKIQWQQMAEQVSQSFVDTFWNGLYL
jgi:predicted glycogen debranching enzyme